MPVNESIDLHAAAKELGLPAGKLIVNGVYPDLFEPEERAMLDDLRARAKPVEGTPGLIASSALDAATTYRVRHDMQREMIDRLGRELKLERFELPALFRPRVSVEEVETLWTTMVTGVQSK